MNQKNLNEKSAFLEDEVDFAKIFKILMDSKWLIVTINTLVCTAAIIYSLSLPDIYQSKALLAPVGSSSSISGAMKNYSSIANLAGVNISAQDAASNSTKALKKLKTLSFFEENILPNIFLPELMALERWDSQTNSLDINQALYESSSDTWIRTASYPQKKIPSSQESYERFIGHLVIAEDNKTGFITLIITHQSPHIAKEWVELLIDQINFFYREKDRVEAEISVGYLNEQIGKTSLTEIKQVMASLLQQEIQKLTLIEANESYVFEYVDPPVAMENKSGPKRALICIISAVLGFMLSILLALVKYFFLKKA